MVSSRHQRLAERFPRIGSALVSLALVSAVGLIAPTSAHATTCPPASAGGQVIGVIKVGNLEIPLVRMRFPRSGVIQPPKTNRVAGVSDAHAPLNADLGTTVIAWHVAYGAQCPGSLNPLLKLPVGGTFTIYDFKSPGQGQLYEVANKVLTPRGRYPASWFNQTGPHRLALFTCADRAGRVFRKTAGIFAFPVVQQSPEAQPIG